MHIENAQKTLAKKPRGSALKKTGFFESRQNPSPKKTKMMGQFSRIFSCRPLPGKSDTLLEQFQKNQNFQKKYLKPLAYAYACAPES